MVKILVVEDEKAISDLIKLNLSLEGYDITTAYDGEAASELIEEQRFDLILLDIMLPKINGYELMEYIRPLEIPVIFLTAKATLDDKMKGLTSGAEDYIVKPFEIVELLARIKIVLRRYNKADEQLRYRDIVVNESKMTVLKSGKLVELAPKEFELLVLFMRNKNISLFRERIYEEIWGTEFPIESRTLDLHVQRLRRKLGIENGLKTVFKIGYRLEDNDEVQI